MISPLFVIFVSILLLFVVVLAFEYISGACASERVSTIEWFFFIVKKKKNKLFSHTLSTPKRNANDAIGARRVAVGGVAAVVRGTRCGRRSRATSATVAVATSSDRFLRRLVRVHARRVGWPARQVRAQVIEILSIHELILTDCSRVCRTRQHCQRCDRQSRDRSRRLCALVESA